MPPSSWCEPPGGGGAVADAPRRRMTRRRDGGCWRAPSARLRARGVRARCRRSIEPGLLPSQLTLSTDGRPRGRACRRVDVRLHRPASRAPSLVAQAATTRARRRSFSAAAKRCAGAGDERVAACAPSGADGARGGVGSLSSGGEESASCVRTKPAAYTDKTPSRRRIDRRRCAADRLALGARSPPERRRA